MPRWSPKEPQKRSKELAITSIEIRPGHGRGAPPWAESKIARGSTGNCKVHKRLACDPNQLPLLPRFIMIKVTWLWWYHVRSFGDPRITPRFRHLLKNLVLWVFGTSRRSGLKPLIWDCPKAGATDWIWIWGPIQKIDRWGFWDHPSLNE